ncbi:hypothetical protein [Salininema proteolyticum]|uniref:Uncharacterized protein n=1 Tax=Salininema proteolyticum TaxID=1607685 RepID=A0ABV8TWN9_9ACTN
MPIVYMPSGTTDVGTIAHAGRELTGRLDEDAAVLYLFLPSRLDCPLEERPPAVMAHCRRWPWPTMTAYSDELHRQSRSIPDWKVELLDKIALAVKPFVAPDD